MSRWKYRWNRKMYMDEKVREKPGRYRKILEKHSRLRGCYCITMPVNPDNCMDIYSSREYWFRHYGEKKLEIIGIAASRESAIDLVGEMAQDVLREYGKFDAVTVRQFFS